MGLPQNSARAFREGVLNGLLTARHGLAAISAVRLQRCANPRSTNSRARCCGGARGGAARRRWTTRGRREWPAHPCPSKNHLSNLAGINHLE
jgi:hypothetical protein